MDEEYQRMAANSIAHEAFCAGQAWQQAAAAHERPCVLWKPRLFIDGNQWCALLGENIQEGVVGFGDSPDAAMWEFDVAWRKKLVPLSVAQGEEKMTDEFQREERYIVFKVSDLGNSLKGDEIRKLAREYAEHRQQLGKEPLKCVVVESDWPEYEPTWKALESRVTGAQPSPSVPTALLVAVADLVAQMEIISRVGFVDTPNDKDSCAAFCVAEGTWLELMSAVESLASALAAAPEAKP